MPKTLMAAMLLASTAYAQDDSSFIDQVLSAEVIELNFLWGKDAPVMPLNPPYSVGLHTSHAETDGMVPGVSFAAEMMYLSGQHGAPTIDAIGHFAANGKIYGGADAAASEGTAGLTAGGIEEYPKEKFVNRGVLLDVARYKGVEVLASDYVITDADLEETAEAQGVEIAAGDSVLIHTGLGKYFDTDREKYMGQAAGIGEASARWLAAKDVFLVGADNMTMDAGFPFPGHRILIAENGIHLVELMNLNELSATLAERGSYEFLLVLNPLRLKGATASPLNAFALLP